MTQVLIVTTGQLRDPVVLLVFVIAHNGLVYSLIQPQWTGRPNCLSAVNRAT